MNARTETEEHGAAGGGTGAMALDPDGFLTDEREWSREVARRLADINEIGPLTPDHWRVIEFVREYFLAHGDGPPVVRIGKATGISPHRICELFPCGIARGAFRLAGLPRPSGCL
jgi:tRNA 2-thiouridine synthesizing protein E